MTNHEGIYAFSLRKGFDAMLRAPFDRAIISALLFVSTAAAPSLLSQSLSKEYLRLGGRVVAVESPFNPLTVSPDPAPIYLSPGNVLGFAANRAVNWSVAPIGAGAVSPLSGTATTLTAANPLPGGLTALILTATDLNGATSKSVSVPVAVPVSISGSTTSMPVGSSAQFSANIPVTWELYPPNAGTISPLSTVGGAPVTVTIAAVPPGFPSAVTLTARDARALTDARLQYNFATRYIPVQYNAGPPQVAGGFGLVNPYNGSGAGRWQFSFSDPLGGQNIYWVAIHFSPPGTQDFTNSCHLYIYPNIPNHLGLTFLWNDTNNNLVYGYAGRDTQLRNSQCLVDLKGLLLTTDGSTLTVDLPVYANPSFMGNRDIYLSVSNNQGQQNPGGYIKQWSNFNFNFLNNATSLATEPNFTNLSTPNFRSSAMTLYPGSSIYLMSLLARDAFNNYCQLAYFPGGGNWVYLYSSNPAVFDNTFLPNNAYTLVTNRCTVATSTIRYDNYLPLSPPAPYVFLNAVIAPNWAMPLGWQSMVGQIHYLNGSYFVDSEKLLGSWLRP